jgi:hypothetical protein
MGQIHKILKKFKIDFLEKPKMLNLVSIGLKMSSEVDMAMATQLRNTLFLYLVHLQSNFFPAKFSVGILEKRILAGKKLLCKEGYSFIFELLKCAFRLIRGREVRIRCNCGSIVGLEMVTYTISWGLVKFGFKKHAN